jgi:UV DNA damage repair endonuclease
MIAKIGFACKLSELHPTKGVVSIPEYNFKTTTVSWLLAQPLQISIDRLWNLIYHNAAAVYNLVNQVSTYVPELRMVRIGSDMLPCYTHKDWKWFYKQHDVVSFLEKNLSLVGELARLNDVRLSFHPGQFCVLASDSDSIVSRSIEEFEYHADMAKWMGYGKQFQDFKINVHIAGRQGPEGIRKVMGKLSPEARNTITIENEENAWGIDDVLTISDIVPIVLDVHHNWVREGVYISPTSDSVKRVVDSWRGVRPTMHYSVSRENWLPGHDVNTLPDYQVLLAEGKKKQKLRAHSDFYWNTACNEWALGFLDNFDIMAESKGKNISSFNLYRQWKNGMDHNSQ